FGRQFFMAVIDGVQRHAEGKLDRRRALRPWAIIAEGPRPARTKRKQGRADSKADPVFLILYDLEPQDIAIEGSGLLQLAAKNDRVVEVRDPAEAHHCLHCAWRRYQGDRLGTSNAAAALYGGLTAARGLWSSVPAWGGDRHSRSAASIL